MALWKYALRHADGSREENLLAAGNRTAALERAQRNAAAKGATLIEEPTLSDAHRGST
ncbi:MAG TPA: hypothetical protein VM370_07305 [Candidatus Thermoplasmatota archaeon]|nr:hypothetical protein [Candidatus Thermoplasmatota archaeon]